MEDCIFCKIINKEMDSSVIYEDDIAISFLDAQPIAPGHAMVLPKNHVENILDLPAEEIEPFFGAVRKTTKKIKESLSPDGFTMGINHGRASGQAIDHLHFHIIPRWEDDGGGSLHTVVDNKPERSLQEIAQRIKNPKN